MINKNIYCVYFHINPFKKEIFNVGKGKGKRPFDKNNRNKSWHNYVNECKNYNVHIIKNNLNEKEAYKLEIYFVKLIGRKDLGIGTLLNKTDGGNGGYGGRKHTKKEIDENRKRNQKKSGKKVFIYDIYDYREPIIFNAQNECLRYLKENEYVKDIGSFHNTIIAGKWFLSHKPITKKQLYNILKLSTIWPRKVLQFNKNWKLIKEWKTANTAVKKYGKSIQSNLDKNKISKTAYGYYWVYKLDWIYDDKEKIKKSLSMPNVYYEKIKKQVNQYDLNDNFIKSWNSISEASKILNICSPNISAVCNGKQKTAHGHKFKWKYNK